MRRGLYSFLPILSYESSIKIISVGNILVGGSGKTPFTVFLAQGLQKMGFKVAVSHRGYRGELENKTTMIADRRKRLPSAHKAGDEPLLLTEKLPKIPIVIGRSRKKSVKLLEKKYPDLDFIILDDSFQHLKVKHHFDFLLFNEVTGLGNGMVLPAGPLRESLSAAKKADCLVYNGQRDNLPNKLQKLGKPCIFTEHRVVRFYDSNRESVAKEIFRENKIALVSAIGKPESFEKTVKIAGIDFVRHYTFLDHYDYKDEKVIQAIAEDKGKVYDKLITTEKDFTKLGKYDGILPLFVVEIETAVVDDEAFAKVLKDLLLLNLRSN